MKEKWYYLLYLIWFSYLVLSAVLMFGHGFLLSRKTFSDLSDCKPISDFDCEGRLNSEKHYLCTEEDKIRRILGNLVPLVCLPKRTRVIFILIDAFRYDFAEYDTSIEHPLPYQNKLPVIHDYLQKYPKSTRLFRFMADPPTTTIQRVKALVTGSLPTFVDASSNFGAMELLEDNVIDQISRIGGKMVFLGDDTWTRLLPNRWMRSHALYSFHTWDLDTVDTEIDSKIYDEVQKDDWDLLVAHYLGIDHAGHRYGPNHPEMTRKLKELNNRIRKIIELLPSDVTLYVIGDHGMTETGDHGGESRVERTAALFAYRGAGFNNNSDKLGTEVQQTDFAVTLSAALGSPPPAPSLGNLLLPILPPLTMPEALIHITTGLKQVTQYLMRYGEESQQVSIERLTQYINSTRYSIAKAANIKNESDFQEYVATVRLLMTDIRTTFREVWIEFDSLSMLRALLLLLLAIFFNWLITEGIPIERIPNIFSSSFVPTGIISVAVVISICLTGNYFGILENLKGAIILSSGLISGAVVAILVIMHWDGICQHWSDGRLLFYERFARTALFASALALLSNSFIIEEGATLSFLFMSVLGLIAWHIGTLRSVLTWVACGVAMAFSRSYRGCREEQGECWTSGLGIVTGLATRGDLVLSLATVGTVVAIARRHVGWRGHGVVAAGTLACSHWAVGWGSLGSLPRSRLLARLAWLALLTMFALLWRRDGRGATLPVTVFGLLLYIANSLVLGASLAPTAGLALLTAFLVINLVSTMKSETSSKFSVNLRCSTTVASMWALLAIYHFYGTGHHATLGHLRWAPVFHAGEPSTTRSFPAYIFLALELFGMPFMFGAAVPLLALWGKNGAGNVGPRTQMAAIFSLCLKFQLCFAIRVFVCALAATIHCRHLMIWGVFTPKLIFEYGTCIAALSGTVIGAALTMWHIPTTHRSS